jgi:hypothetical protein
MNVRSVSATLLLLAACAPAAEEVPEVAAPQVVTYTATDFAFTGPDTIAPGYTDIRLVNNGEQEHHIVLARLDDGKTLQELNALMANNPGAEPEWLVFVGGAGSVTKGDSSAAISDLAPGNYVLFCFIPDPSDHVPHHAKGMVRELVVTGERREAELPVIAGDIRLKDFAFEHQTLTAGTHTFRVVNDGPQTHEIFMVRLNDGVTAEQYMAASAPGSTTPPPAKFLGGNGALSNGEINYWSVTLAPGTYLMLCYVPDLTDGAPHVVKGMMQEIVITAS